MSTKISPEYSTVPNSSFQIKERGKVADGIRRSAEIGKERETQGGKP